MTGRRNADRDSANTLCSKRFENALPARHADGAVIEFESRFLKLQNTDAQFVLGGSSPVFRMDRDEYIEMVRRQAEANGGRPLGEKAFYRATGTQKSARFNAGFTTYNEAVSAAGFTPNKLVAAHDTATVLAALAELTRRLGRLPRQSDLKVARRKNPTLPSYEAASRVVGGWSVGLDNSLREFCGRVREFRDVLELLPASSEGGAPKQAADNGRVRGYVYLARHGKDYKIGRSNDTTRRRRELSLILPRELEHVHIIETDDPEGIEAYWHQRFAARRIRGEWFELKADDVAAFRRRRYQ